jgi:hypothetical protein
VLPRPATGLLLAFVTLMVALLGATAEHETAVLPAGSSTVEIEPESCPVAPAHPHPRCSHRSARLAAAAKAAAGEQSAGPARTLEPTGRPDAAAASNEAWALTRAASRSPAALQVFRT